LYLLTYLHLSVTDAYVPRILNKCFKLHCGLCSISFLVYVPGLSCKHWRRYASFSGRKHA